MGEPNPDNTKLDDNYLDFINSSNPFAPPDNSVNKLDPDEIGFSGVLNTKIRDIATVNDAFEKINANEGFDYAVLESARKLSSQEYTFHPQLGYISLNQRLSNDEVLGVAFQFTHLGRHIRLENLLMEIFQNFSNSTKSKFYSRPRSARTSSNK